MSHRDFDLLAVGDLCPDLILTGDVTPAFGQVEKLIEAATLTVGGSTTIFACGAARLGLRTVFSGVAGDDEFGAFMQRSLAARGVAMDGLAIDSTLSTGLSVHLSRGSDRAILTYSGSIAGLRFSHLDLSLLSRVRHLHLGSYFLLDGLRPDVPELFERAHALGVTTSLDTNYDPAERWDSGLLRVLSRTDVFFPNEIEACAITGARDPRAALAALAQLVPTVALKLGAAGSMVRQGDLEVSTAALSAPVIDSTGAGDTFDAGFLYGWLHKWPLDRCLRLANACGSLATRKAGGVDSQPTLAEALVAAGLQSEPG
ncbi:MAG: sugar kinase [Caldilineaceae bacterium]|nr:sugar kinase [Caldilineaceae bacterium]